MKLASLCSGYGGLDMAVEMVLGPLEVAWFAEIEPRAAAVFAAHHPGVPNLGDLTAITDTPPVDILTGGFPCQPVSSAGKRAGTDDERWLFDDICTLVGRMDPRPRLLIFENVRGLLTANDGDAMARVVHGLARLGYVGSWRTVRASDVGAPHQRARVFIVAADATVASGEALVGRREPEKPVVGCGASADATHVRLQRSRDAWHGRPGSAVCDFGPYAAAVERWERILDRPAPHPAPDGRLSATFVEWMMGMPAGWVTDHEPKRTHALRILGNGVVPQQAAHALRLLLEPMEAAA